MIAEAFLPPRVVVYEGAGATPLPATDRASIFAALLDRGYAVTRAGVAAADLQAGGALIDIQTLLAPYGVTHICLFHSPKDTGPNGIQAIRGHGSAGGAVSACISLHFMEKRCPMKKIWIADKDNPHRRMVVEGRAPFQDLLIRGDWAAGTFEVIGEYQKAIAQLLADEGKARAVDGLTDARRQVLEVIGGTSGVDGATLLQIAQGVHGTSEPTHSQKETIRHQCLAMVKDGLLRKRDLHGRTFFSVAPGVLTG